MKPASFRYAWSGIVSAFRSEVNMRIHVIALVVVIAAGFYYEISPMEWIAIFLCAGAVITAELLNTALEHLTDLLSPEHQVKAGLAKDVAAGAVLVAAITSVIVALFIFLPHFVISPTS